MFFHGVVTFFSFYLLASVPVNRSRYYNTLYIYALWKLRHIPDLEVISLGQSVLLNPASYNVKADYSNYYLIFLSVYLLKTSVVLDCGVLGITCARRRRIGRGIIEGGEEEEAETM